MPALALCRAGFGRRYQPGEMFQIVGIEDAELIGCIWPSAISYSEEPM